MESDFSGYVTKAGLMCADGRTITSGAFKHQDQTQVPLVWMHSHTDPENVLGHVLLEDREDGVYGHAFFNSSKRAQHMKEAVQNGDIKNMSIWANELIERSKRVMHGAIREVSLVLSGANPGAVIENVTIRHSDGDLETFDNEVIVYTDDDFVVHGTLESDDDDNSDNSDSLQHADEDDDDDETVADVYNSMTPKQKEVLHFMVGEALEAGDNVKHSALDDDDDDADSDDSDDSDENSDDDDSDDSDDSNDADDTDSSDTTDTSTDAKHGNTNQEGSEMGKHNVFEDSTSTDPAHTISHDAMAGIFTAATKSGSLKEAITEYALSHGINDIDTLFPDAKALSQTPEFLSRRTEWVASFLGACKKSPFARVKSVWADITEDQARAKGYITGTLKREEFFSVAKRVTTPTTIYKKQKLDRDDMVDITDFDVIAWLKSEMRIMLDEELARAILIGDGRDVSDVDKINEQNIRPIAKDHELYSITVNVNLDDGSSSITEFIDAVVKHRSLWKGSGTPTLYTTELYIGKLMMLRDTLGRRIYKTLDEVAAELRVGSIIPVEAMEEEPAVVGILVNPVDYVIGADKGGALAMFDDFDIDYNQYKYLIETRVSGALSRLKSAIVFRKVASTAVLVSPTEPSFTGDAVTIPTVTGVVYKNGAGTVINAAGSPYAVADDATYVVTAEPASASYYFESSENDRWEFTGADLTP